MKAAGLSEMLWGINVRTILCCASTIQTLSEQFSLC